MSSNDCAEDQIWKERCRKELERFLFERGQDVIITGMKLSPGCPVGENFVGEITRVEVTGTRNAQEGFNESFIVKKIPGPTSVNHKFFNCRRMFENEGTAYELVVRNLDEFAGGRLGDCFAGYFGRAYDFIALEDLKPKGYRMGNRMRGFNLRECSLVVEKLSFFHAVSLSMKAKRRDVFDATTRELRETVFCGELAEGVVDAYRENAIKMAIRSLKSGTDEKSHRAAMILTSYLGSVLSGIVEAIKPEEPFDVVCHGDLWTNNILLRYADGMAQDIKVIDLQTMRHGSCVLDVMHLLFTSLETNLLKDNLKAIIADYYRDLVENMRRFDAAPNFSLEDLMTEFKDKVRYGLCMACLVFTFVTKREPESEGETVLTKEELSAEEAIERAYRSLNDLYHERLLDLVTALTSLQMM